MHLGDLFGRLAGNFFRSCIRPDRAKAGAHPSGLRLLAFDPVAERPEAICAPVPELVYPLFRSNAFRIQFRQVALQSRFVAPAPDLLIQ